LRIAIALDPTLRAFAALNRAQPRATRLCAIGAHEYGKLLAPARVVHRLWMAVWKKLEGACSRAKRGRSQRNRACPQLWTTGDALARASAPA
jgi:hypothetical protein